MVVDDDTDVREILTSILRDHGYAVVSVEDGVVAVAVLTDATDVPCLILLDLQMPKMDGHEVLTWLRAQPRFIDVPVCVITASGARSIDGAQHTLSKPIDMDTLLMLVQGHCVPANRKAVEPEPLRVAQPCSEVSASRRLIKESRMLLDASHARVRRVETRIARSLVAIAKHARAA
jgi:CheY-like chemotaxis protein